MKLSLLSMLGLTSSLFVFAACGQVQETTTPAPKATSSTVTPPPVPTTPPTTTATTKPEDPPPPPFEKISFPQAQTHGGKVIKTPKVLPVLFAGDPMIGKIGDFHSQLATSTYWKTIASEYGIGDITPLAPVILEEAPPTQATDDDVKAWLTNKLQNDTVLGAADSDTLYALYYPSGTTIMLDGQRSCRSFGGYHNEGDPWLEQRYS